MPTDPTWRAEFYKNMKRQTGDDVDMYVIRGDVETNKDIVTLGINVQGGAGTQVLADWIADALNDMEQIMGPP